jgi:hypothetical protein
MCNESVCLKIYYTIHSVLSHGVAIYDNANTEKMQCSHVPKPLSGEAIVTECFYTYVYICSRGLEWLDLETPVEICALTFTTNSTPVNIYYCFCLHNRYRVSLLQAKQYRITLFSCNTHFCVMCLFVR